MKQYTDKDFYLSDKEIDNITDKTRKALAKQEKVRIMIPSRGENDKRWEGSINGLGLMFPTDEYIDVPTSLAHVIENNRKVLRDGAKTTAAYAEGNGKKLG